MLHTLVHRLTHVGHRRLPSASTPERGSQSLVGMAAIRTLLLSSVMVAGLFAVGLTVLYASAAVQSLIGDLLIWFVGVVAAMALPSLTVLIGRLLFR